MFEEENWISKNARKNDNLLINSILPSLAHDEKACPSSARSTPNCHVVDTGSVGPSPIPSENMSRSIDGALIERKHMEERCYPEIGNNTRNIRLLVLLPMRHPSDNRIQCNLITAPLRNPPSYEALSYTWGEPDSLDRKVRVNGMLVGVRDNLHNALEALYASCNERERLLWIDALCINQFNVFERNHQVKMMGSIYMTACRVLVWLGTPTLDASGDTTKSHSPSKYGATNPSPGFDLVKDALKYLGHWSFNNEEFKSMFGLAYPYHDRYSLHWEQLAELCNAGYWRRLCIVQEVGLASTIRLLYGSDVLEWDAFSSLRRWLDDSHFGALACLPDHHMQQRLGEAIMSIKDSMPAELDRQWIYPRLVPSLKSLLITCEFSICRDPRDKIYGLLGLAKDVKEGDICIDYQQSPLELYESVVHFYRTKRHQVDTCLR